MTPAAWRKSSYSGSNNCVEVLLDTRAVSIRDSKYLRVPTNHPAAQPILTVTPQQWTDFLAAIRRQDARRSPLEYRTADDGTIQLARTDQATTLTFSPQEWDAFLSGCHAGEFTPQH